MRFLIYKGIVYEVYDRVKEILEVENETRRMILSGVPVEEILQKGKI